MSENYYYNSLYNLQDLVLNHIQNLNTSFYLTGGTALSRVYTKHRYSDDLDFFVNDSPNYKPDVDKIENKLQNEFIGDLTASLKTETFSRFFLKHDEVTLKIEFVNDVEHHYGDFESNKLFNRIDNPLNILSNKICALSRNEAKDISDILFISKEFRFNWRDIIENSKLKDTWVNETEVSEKIGLFPVERFSEIKWIEQPSQTCIVDSLSKIAKDILKGTENSLYKVVSS